MKTTIYNLQKGIITAVLVLVISTVGSAATKVRETPTLSNSNKAEVSVVKNEADASIGTAFTETATEANVRDLSDQIADWMSNGSFWEADNTSVTTEKDLASEIESWIANGSYWKSARNGQNSGRRITHKIKSWMANGSFWAPDGE